MAVSESIKRIVWVRAGGRCVLCRTAVLDDSMAPVPIGDVAHAVGQGDGPTTPRLVPEMPPEERNAAENLLLLCQPCHRKVDNKSVEPAYDIPTLQELKREHEKLAQHLLSLMDSSLTLVLRMIGTVRGNLVSASRLEVGAAAAARGRVPAYLDNRHHSELEIDLTGVTEDDPAYWDVQRRAVEKGVAEALDALRTGTADHLTVFAFARLPLLILLGWLLDDTIRTDIAQRSRGPQAWRPVDGATHTFTTQLTDGTADTPEALLVLQLSGTPELGKLPDCVTHLARATVAPADCAPHAGIADTEATREAFDRELRRALGQLEARLVAPSTLHVVAATPIAPAVALGRAIDPQVFPTVHVYDLGSDGVYRKALTLDSEDTLT